MNSDAYTNNSIYNGFYAKGSEIKTSDIDIVGELLLVVKEKFKRSCVFSELLSYGKVIVI